MDVIEWLLDSDPAIRWQVLAHVVDSDPDTVALERDRIAHEGWGSRLLGARDENGLWRGGAHFPGEFDWNDLVRDDQGRVIGQPWSATSWSLTLLRLIGLDPGSEEAQEMIALVAENGRWEHASQPYFEGEVEPCINGLTVANGSYFGVDTSGIVERLLSEQMEDGGWNCEQESGSVRGSFHTTIAVLEGLLEYEMAFGDQPDLTTARILGEDYLLERRLLRRLSTGELVDPLWLEFSFPYWWHYDLLRGLDYMCLAGRGEDERLTEGLDAVSEAMDANGFWRRGRVYPGEVLFEMEGPEGEPSRWNTLRALRIYKTVGLSLS